jgi:dihydroxyacetone kinase-like predicted kinase
MTDVFEKRISARHIRIARCVYDRFLRISPAINDINVFPVPDGDTGGNIAATIKGAVDAIEKNNGDLRLRDFLLTISQGMLFSSRGCSGIILSMYVKGVMTHLGNHGVSPEQVGKALAQGYEEAFAGTAEPVEGTILTLMRALSARYMERCQPGMTAVQTIRACIPHVKRVLKRTPKMLPLLKSAGVVDSGGAAFLVVLQGIIDELDSKKQVGKWFLRNRSSFGLPSPKRSSRLKNIQGGSLQPTGTGEGLYGRGELDLQYRYCTEAVFTPESDLSDDRITSAIEPFGGDVFVLRDASTYKIHVHTNAPHKVFEYLSSNGNVASKKIDDMKEQHRHFFRSILLFVVNGEGFGTILKGLGAGHVLTYRGRRPSINRLVKTLSSLNSKSVDVVPDNRSVEIAIRKASRRVTSKVTRLDTNSPVDLVQRLINGPTEALGNPDPSSSDCRQTEGIISIVKHRRPFMGHRYSALNCETLLGRDTNLARLIETSLRSVLDGESLITIYRGKRIASNSGLIADLRSKFESLSIEDYYGGQSNNAYTISFE